MATYQYTSSGSSQNSANITTDKVRISTITPVGYTTGFPRTQANGTVTAATNSKTITGSSSTFLVDLQPGYWVGNNTGVTVGIVQSITSNLSLTLNVNANVVINAGGNLTYSPYGVTYSIATANSEIIPGNTVLNSVIVGQGNVVSFITPTGVTANAFSITELGMPHANSGATGFPQPLTP